MYTKHSYICTGNKQILIVIYTFEEDKNGIFILLKFF